MKITFLTPNSMLVGGGVERWIFEVCRELSFKHETRVISLDYLPERRWGQKELTNLERYATYDEFPSVKPPRGFALPSPFHLTRLLDALNSCDLTYVIVPKGPIELLLYVLGFGLKTRLIAGFHGSLSANTMLERLYLHLLRRALRAFKAYHVLNKQMLGWLSESGFRDVFCVPNGVDTNMFKLSSNLPKSASFNVFFTGRLSEDKGADLLVRIIRDINERLRIRNVKFTVCGSGSFEHEVREIAEKYENVKYLSFVSPEYLPELYQRSHLLLIPSRTEGMPLSLLEAQSCGLPAVGSRIPGISDIVTDKENGRLIKVGDIKGFATAVREYYLSWASAPEQYFKLNRTIREFTRRGYDWKVVIPRLEKAFEKCIGSR